MKGPHAVYTRPPDKVGRALDFLPAWQHYQASEKEMPRVVKPPVWWSWCLCLPWASVQTPPTSVASEELPTGEHTSLGFRPACFGQRPPSVLCLRHLLPSPFP